MPPRSLLEPVIEGGIANPNWFEGRLLTAEAMRAKDTAERTRQRLLGRAIGAGVFEGLFVSRGDAVDGVVKTLHITKGAAINGEGDVLLLSRDVTVDVVPPPGPVELAQSLFEPCTTSDVATIPNGYGLYVLLMAPASGYRERAPKSGLGTEGIVTGCGEAFAVDGVKFRTEKLEPTSISGLSAQARAELDDLVAGSSDPRSQSMLRNLAAHYCFGTPELAGFPVDPFATSSGASDWLFFGAIDDLRGLNRITDCDVPIALILWNADGVAFVDLWAARRAPISGPVALDWPLVVGQRTQLDARARFLQFQSHVADLAAQASLPGNIQARQNFRYLPPAGLLPIESGARRGLTVAAFFQDVTVRYPRPPRYGLEDGPEFLDGPRLLALLSAAYQHSALDLQALGPASRTSEAVWLYRVRENTRAIDRSQVPAPTRLVVFASGEMPYFGSPRFDVARWNYGNYSSSWVGPGGL
jgi:hypothetical protein